MDYLSLDKESLVNLEYSLNREILSTNRAGGYLSTTLPLCNTRKYHGLMVLPLEKFNFENFVLLSSLDETIITEERSFNLGIHKYPKIYSPRGHKYLVDFKYAPTPTLWYRVGNIVLKKELLFAHKKENLMIRYTVETAPATFEMRMKPFLAFRRTHDLTYANMTANTRYKEVENGVSFKLYSGFPRLHLQLNKRSNWIASPEWYHEIEYKEEIARGYPGHEDLMVPGYFEILMKKGDQLIFSASTSEVKTKSLSGSFKKEVASRPPKDNFENCLRNSASQFIVHRDQMTQIIAGFPWFGRWGRDTFISLPGLTLSLGDTETCIQVLDSLIKEMKNGFFPNTGNKGQVLFNSVDAPLWFFWVLQRYLLVDNNPQFIWKKYSKTMKAILETYRNGGIYSVRMHDNGLIWQGESSVALTWMDAVVDGVPVTPRTGYAVEICALWYNAIKFTLEMAEINGDKAFVKKWQDLPGVIEKHFMELFWYEKERYLADYVDDKGQNIDMRPNQIFAISLPYSLVPLEQQRHVIDRVRSELCTPKGLRTLSPRSPAYIGEYQGGQESRDRAYHQGTAWPWLLGHFFTSYIKVRGKDDTFQLCEDFLYGFEQDMTTYGIASIAEIYDGDPPHRPKGSISQAWSIAEIIRILKFVQKEKN